MKNFLIPSTVLALILIVQLIGQNNERRQQQYLDHVIAEAQHSMQEVAANPNLQVRPIELEATHYE
jgi:hypothetical protein